MNALKEMFDKIESITITIDPGINKHDAYKQALIYSATFGCTVDFNFNVCTYRIDANAIINKLLGQ